jgi:hypothetical protein
VGFENESKLLRIEKGAFRETGLREIVIPTSVKVLGEGCFARCKSLKFVRFESDSKLVRIRKGAFRESGLREIVIPAAVEVLEDECFVGCVWIESVNIEGGSRLRRVGKKAFSGVVNPPRIPTKKCSVWQTYSPFWYSRLVINLKSHVDARGWFGSSRFVSE